MKGMGKVLKAPCPRVGVTVGTLCFADPTPLEFRTGVKMRHAAWQSPWQRYLQNRTPRLIGANLRRDRWRCAAGLPQKAVAAAVALGFRVGPILLQKSFGDHCRIVIRSQ
jgi:hypothetical protein